MRVAIIGSDNFDSLEFHLHDELVHLGYEARIFDYKTHFGRKLDFGIIKLVPEFEEFKNKRLLVNVLEYNPDLVIGIYRNIHPTVVRAIKSRKIKIIHINPDALTTFQNQQLFVEPYDAYFSKDPFIVRFMKEKLELNVFHYHEAFNPRVHKAPNKNFSELENEIGIDVLCFGTLYPYRNRMLKLLKDKGVNLTLYGTKARYFENQLESNYKKKEIYGEEKSRLLNGAKIVFNNYHYAEIESVNNKFFEISGSGAFQLMDYKPILNDLLPVDPKRVSYLSIEEAHKLITHYLNNPEERWEIRSKIYKHFIKNYTYKQLLEKVFNSI
jgi:spore maturation protein CgeB